MGRGGGPASLGYAAWLSPTHRVASLLAYAVGEFLNAYVLSKLKVATKGRFLWLRTIGSSLVGQGVDTLIFFPVAYAGEWSWSLILEIMAVAYVIKVGVEVLLTPLTYGVVTVPNASAALTSTITTRRSIRFDSASMSSIVRPGLNKRNQRIVSPYKGRTRRPVPWPRQ